MALEERFQDMAKTTAVVLARMNNQVKEMTMKKKVFYRYLLGGLMMAVTVACSGSDDDNTVPTPTDDTLKTVRLTITQIDNDGSADARLMDGTRATLSESGKTLAASWVANDGLTYYNLNQQFISDQLMYVFGPLTATETAAKSSFTGDVTCSAENKLAVIYPALDLEKNPLSTYAISPYTISLDGQNGTLGKLATTFHYVYGVATVKSVTGTTATATMPKMKSLLTVCKFSFIDKANSSPISVNTLSISLSNDGVYGKKDTYPQSAMVTPGENQSDVHAAAVTSGSALTMTLPEASNEVYVALLPTPTDATQPVSLTFTVNDGSNTYSGTAKAHLKEGEYVVAENLKLTKQ